MNVKTYWCVYHRSSGIGPVDDSLENRPQGSGAGMCWLMAYSAEVDDATVETYGGCDMRPATVEYGVTAAEIREYIGVPA